MMRTQSYIQHSCTVHEHRLTVPLDPTGHAFPGRTIEIFARQIIAQGGESKPLLVFLQGGPGGAGPRVGNFGDGWIGEALKHYQVLLLDQRGTGASSPLSTEIILAEDNPELFLTMFLQNQILADAEAFRTELSPGKRWATLGQSYGGFLTLGYLSQHPEAISESYVTGGLAGMCGVDQIYEHTYPLTAARNRAFFSRYPNDQQTIREVAAHLGTHDERLPTGERLSPTRLRSVGLDLGGAMSFDTLHYLWENPFETRGGNKRLTPRFLTEIGNRVSSQMSPLYWVLQEAIYGQTTADQTKLGTNWAAQRLASQFPGFNLDANPLDTSEPWYLTGEHCFKALIEEDPAISALLPVVNQLATRTNWETTYDVSALGKVETPVAALIYDEDMYVPCELSKQTANLIPTTRTWVTNEMQHDGLRANGQQVFQRLHQLIQD